MEATLRPSRPLPSPVIACPAASCSISPDQLPWFRIALGIFVACQTMLLGLTINLTEPDDALTLQLLRYGMLGATMLVLLLLGLPLAGDALADLRRRRLSMELFFLIGITGAMAISLMPFFGRPGPVYFEVVNLLLVIYSIGRAIHTHSRARALAAASSLACEAATARRLQDDDQEIVPVEQIAPGDRVRVLAGELIPVDGIVLEGESLVRQTAFTGEWTSVRRRPGQQVLAATAAEDGSLVIQATSPGTDRSVDRLASLIRTACGSPTHLQRLADRFVSLFLPLVLATALVAGTVWAWQDGLPRGLFVGLSVILVACPCAAGLATPLTLWRLLGRLARMGLVLRSAETVERLSQVDMVILDKTGTLANDQLKLTRLEFSPGADSLARKLIKATEQQSHHPAAVALRDVLAPDDGVNVSVRSVRTIPGRGVEAQVEIDGRPHRFKLVRCKSKDQESLCLEGLLDDRPVAMATLQEYLRESAVLAVEGFRELGIPVLVLTGDSSPAVRRAQRLATVEIGLTPEAKLARVETLGKQHRLLYVGDGVNDAAAMARSHAAVAMAHGAEVTVETAAATLHGGDLSLLPEAVSLAREARNTIRSNLLFALAYNLIGITLAAAGWLHPVVAAVLMSLSSACVAWRAAHQRPRRHPATQPPAAKAPATAPLPLPPRLPHWLKLLHLAGLAGQAAILIPLARLQGPQIIAAIAAPLALAFVLLSLGRQRSTWTDHFLGMLTLGGFGMNMGWWYDLDLGSAAGADGTVHTCCALAASLNATELTHSSHWMYWGMLLLGIPGMLLNRQANTFGLLLRSCLRVGTLLSVIGMCFGMWAGAQLALSLGNTMDAQSQVLASYALMVVGMLAGMALPLALQVAFTRPPRGDEGLLGSST